MGQNGESPLLGKGLRKNSSQNNRVLVLKRTRPLVQSFSTEQRIHHCVLATIVAALSEALIRQRLFYPLASLDISGQQLVFVQ